MPRQSLSALITTPIPRWWSANLSVARRFIADTLRYGVTLTFDLEHV